MFTYKECYNLNVGMSASNKIPQNALICTLLINKLPIRNNKYNNLLGFESLCKKTFPHKETLQVDKEISVCCHRCLMKK